MKRRNFIKHVGHAVAVPSLISSFGFSMPGKHTMENLLKYAVDSDKVLVMIFMEGGNDGLNTVIPLDQLSALNNARPHVIMPDDKLLPLRQSEVAFHPSLPNFKSLYEENRLQVIQSVGYDEQNYSHFRSTDIWMSGSDSNELINTGWSGRMLNQEHPGFPTEYPNEEMPDPLAIEIGFGSSLLFQGPTASMSMVIGSSTSFYQLINNEEVEAPDTNAGDKLEFIRLVARQSQQYGDVVKAAAEKVNSHAQYPDDNRLANQLKIISKLIKGGLKTPLYMVRIGGFDTHDAQVEANDHATGEHADLLKTLDDAVMAFMKDLEYQGTDDKVLGMTFSEFGRRIVSNASLGTDHGAAAPMFVFGNAVKGGVLGDNPTIPSAATYGDNLQMQYDYRQVYASIMEQWLGISASNISATLINDYSTLPIIGEGVISGTADKLAADFKVYPNPLNGQAIIDFISNGESMSIELADMQGRKVSQIFSGKLPMGKQQLPWDTSKLKSGRYFVIQNSESGRKAFSVVK